MVLAAINLIRLMQSLIGFALPLSKIATGTGSIISVSPNEDGSVTVSKLFNPKNEEHHKMLNHVYAALSANTCQYIPVFTVKLCCLTTWEVEIEPVGHEVLPANTIELLWAVWCVLQALRVMHSQGIYHCDIRWPNILQTCRPDRWLLIDWDEACTAGQDISYLKASPAHKPTSSAEADIWMVGNLLTYKQLDSKLTQNQDVQHFSSWLSSQPTAEAALSHKWLTTPRFDDPLWELPASRSPEIRKLLSQALPI